MDDLSKRLLPPELAGEPAKPPKQPRKPPQAPAPQQQKKTKKASGSSTPATDTPSSSGVRKRKETQGVPLAGYPPPDSDEGIYTMSTKKERKKKEKRHKNANRTAEQTMTINALAGPRVAESSLGNNLNQLSFLRFFMLFWDQSTRRNVKVSTLEKEIARTGKFAFILFILLAWLFYSHYIVQAGEAVLAPIAIIFVAAYGIRFIFVCGFWLKYYYRLLHPVPRADHEDTIVVCIPAYNEDEAAFRSTLESVRDSTYKSGNLEIVVIIDGDKGDTLASLMSVMDSQNPEYQHWLRIKKARKEFTKRVFERNSDVLREIEIDNELYIQSGGDFIKYLKIKESLGHSQKRLFQGVFTAISERKNAPVRIPYTVFLKDENKGKRDSQWLFSELMRHWLSKSQRPPFMLFVDSDTSFKHDSIEILHDRLRANPKLAGVCGHLELRNKPTRFFFPSYWKEVKEAGEGAWKVLNDLSSIFIVGNQYYEYFFSQAMGKASESIFHSVLCLPGAFTMFRTDAIINLGMSEEPGFCKWSESEVEGLMEGLRNYRQAIKNTGRTDTLETQGQTMQYVNMLKDPSSTQANKLMLNYSTFFSKVPRGLFQRNLYDLGEDRTLTVLLLADGYYCDYEPDAICYTEVPDTITGFISQRRRWNNSTFINLVTLPYYLGSWTCMRCWPVLFLSMFDLVNSFLMPASAAMLMNYVWDSTMLEIGSVFPYLDINALYVVMRWIILQLIVFSTTTIGMSTSFHVLNVFTTMILQAVSSYTFAVDQVYPIIHNFAETGFSGDWPKALIGLVFLGVQILVSLLAAKPLMMLTFPFFFLLLPFTTITLNLYAFLHLDDFSWGTR